MFVTMGRRWPLMIDPQGGRLQNRHFANFRTVFRAFRRLKSTSKLARYTINSILTVERAQKLWKPVFAEKIFIACKRLPQGQANRWIKAMYRFPFECLVCSSNQTCSTVA
jgi:hypothetical protein